MEGIRRRLTRPTVFVLDDCQERFAELAGLHYQASRLLRGRGWIVLVARTASGGESGPRFEGSELEDELVTAGSAVVFENTQAFFQQVVERRRPELSGLSEERMSRLFERSAHDLALLDAVLASVREPADVDRLDSEQIFETALKHYFDKLPLKADRLFDLAALAQFELAPTADWLPLDDLRREAPRAEALVAYVGSPPRALFVHASAAELIARSLALLHGRDYKKDSVASLLCFLHRPGASDAVRVEDLVALLRHRLQIAEPGEEASVKGARLGTSERFR